MANRRVSVSAQRGPRSSPSHRISTSCSKASESSPLILFTGKQTTSTRRAEPREVRRSARLQAILQHEGRSRRKDTEAGLSSTDGTSQDQAVGISLVLLLAIC